MKLCTCKHCLIKFYSRVSSCTCSECIEVDDMIFRQIKVYLKNYPNSSAVQIAEALNITAYTVLRYIEEGRLKTGTGTFEQLR